MWLHTLQQVCSVGSVKYQDMDMGSQELKGYEDLSVREENDEEEE